MSFIRLKPAVTTVQGLKQHLAAERPLPLHLTGLTSHWPASSLWTLKDGLAALRNGVGEDREVTVELGKKGRGYLDKDYQRISMGFGLFLDAFILGRVPSSTHPDELPRAYLAQSDLLDSAPSLRKHVPDLEHYTSGPRGDVFRRTIWIGPAVSWTPFHKDPYIGIYNQILGTKKFHLLPPEAERLLSPSSSPRFKNTSTIPISVSALASLHNSAQPDMHADIPPTILDKSKQALEEAAALDGSCEICLEPGDSVLVPEGWWHSAEGGNSPGIGVGAWFR